MSSPVSSGASNLKISTKRKRVNDEEASAPNETASKSTSARKSKAADRAEKVYNDGIKVIEQGIKSLDKKVKNQKWPDMNDLFLAITNDDYAQDAVRHLPLVEELKAMDGGSLFAFNLTMAIADTAYTDLDETAKMSGWGYHEGPYAKLDESLLELIQSREKPSTKLETLPQVPRRWKYTDAEVGPFKTGRPNKQQRGRIFNQRTEWEEKRREAKRTRRETTSDWVSVTLSELKEERDYLDQYGVEGYFPKSITALEQLADLF